MHISMKRVLVLGVLSCLLTGPAGAAETLPFEEPLFDWKHILNDPLDAKVLKSTEAEGLVVEEIEYTSQVKDGKPERIFGILAYPKGGKNLPAVFWGQPGMYDAGDYFPKVFARKGYICFNITAPHSIRNSFGTFDAKEPRNANLTRLAIDHLRAITYLAQRPETDKARMGVGGSSYGGFFATLIAGADPRIKAGFSFYGAGRQKLGTNLPQFNGMANQDEAATWDTTIDPAWRLTKRNVPFLWCLPANDHWFHLPAGVKTYEQSIGEKRLAIVPYWQHAFPENVDQMLIDWLDTCLTRTRKPYNQPSALEVKNEEGKLIGRWSWTGENPVKKAELVVCYGPALPWHGWVQRHHEVLPAAIEGDKASAVITVPKKDIEMYVYGNITDDKAVLISTLPVTVSPSALGIKKVDPKLVVNCYPIGGFEPDDMVFMDRSGFPHGAADTAEKHGGAQSMRIDAKPGVTVTLWNIPGQGHTLKLWLKAKDKATVDVAVAGIPPQNWKSALVDQLRRGVEPAPMTVSSNMPQFGVQAQVVNQWQAITVDCPYDGHPVEGYTLALIPVKDSPLPVWVDDVRFEPVWK